MKPEVETASGRVRGAELQGIRIFRGIPYARAPRGPLRFAPPQPAEPWKGRLDATRSGPAPPQVRLPVFRAATLAGARRTSEDCLTLNVWTPGLGGARRPVMVWIHGGGFLIGSGSTPLYDGRSLARRGDVVVVTINYRLGALGFLDLAGVLGPEFKGCSNAGLRDQIAALQWVRENIERFGGDPGNVTVFGQSAGGMSVGSLLAAPSARGLFHRAIPQSGAASHSLDPDEAREVTSVFLSELGGPAPDRRALGAIPVGRIIEAQHRTMARFVSRRRIMVFLPSVDGDVLPEAPLACARAGRAAPVPLLIGTTLEEWKLFRLLDEGLFSMSEPALEEMVAEVLLDQAAAPLPGAAIDAYRAALRARGEPTTPAEVWSAFQSANVFHDPATRLADAHAGAGREVYSYLFTWRPPLRRSLGACHALELLFLFGVTQHALARPFTGFDRSALPLSRQLQDAWLAFARDGDPDHAGLPGWERYDAERRHTMVLGRECLLEPSPLEAERALWAEWRA